MPIVSGCAKLRLVAFHLGHTPYGGSKVNHCAINRLRSVNDYPISPSRNRNDNFISMPFIDSLISYFSNFDSVELTDLARESKLSMALGKFFIS